MTATQAKHRVHVSGLAKTAVHRREGNQCYEEENAIGDFFYSRGCAVTGVSLLVDNRSNRSRGFAFVEFDDEDSFQKACALNGTDCPDGIRLDDKAAGRIQVSPARPSPEDIRNKQLELTMERNKTEGLEKTLRLIAARINEKMNLIEAQRARQLALQDKVSVEEALNEERQRQGAILSEIQELNKMEASLAKELRAETERTHALEELHAHVDSEHLDHQSEHHTPPPVHVEPARERTVKPRIEPEAEELHRSISRSATAAAGAGAAMPPPPSTTTSTPEGTSATWLQKRGEKQEEGLKRAASLSHMDISRGILDTKMEALERATTGESAGSKKTKVEEKKPRRESTEYRPRWGDIEDEDEEDGDADTASLAALSIWGRGGGRTDVQVKNLPKLNPEDIKVEMEQEIYRIWELSERQRPKIEAIRILEKEVVGGKTAYEARVIFKDPYDAWLMVESYGSKEWSSELCPTLHGKVLQVDWPPRAPQPPPDFRTLRHVCRQADTDASSQISYNTVGTNTSSQRGSRPGDPTVRTLNQPTAPRTGPGMPDAHGQYVPPQNRTVILSGIPTMLKEYDVKKEILSLLQRLYQKNGFAFSPEAHLHKGEEGIEVRAAGSRNEENGGSVKLRLRNYADAIWLVEQAARLRIADCRLKATWAQPRDGKGGAGAGGAAAAAGAGGGAAFQGGKGPHAGGGKGEMPVTRQYSGGSSKGDGHYGYPMTRQYSGDRKGGKGGW
mmetsp:Transcript_26787/g.58243  ORF Transcript_26787/g.58243 Transcript_26787/m.58243 type:complete len:731 (-) Transcript_26787:364-2556(-)|eukprot:CAMPEP_0206453642 /NCGR_PEP_ID=MMETSP0324_2-20121206/20668_1 /ASSEMBLY_ACC=CAM_ASM_000836 /TAXON_ID=2866 /ORGANISM="Crypthecodinium cohnii, Strain Seligo" /LENGTH=730 /DNA_ID=CAMNT_0053923973 /DNA_START=249 /DNA_END=2441 /DNA_ORIENTATION=+